MATSFQCGKDEAPQPGPSICSYVSDRPNYGDPEINDVVPLTLDGRSLPTTISEGEYYLTDIYALLLQDYLINFSAAPGVPR